MTYGFEAIFAGSLLTLTLLVATHLALWPYRRTWFRRFHAYAVGVTCIGAGITLISLLSDDWMPTIIFVAVALPGGLAVGVAHWTRWVLDEKRRGRDTAERIISRAEERLNHAVSGESDYHRN